MGLKKNLENLFAAAAFAEVGEFGTAKTLGARRSVLLVLTGTVNDRASVKYALSMSKRVDASVEVLYVSMRVEEGGILAYLEGEAAREDILFKVVKSAGCLKKAVIAHTEKRRDISLVVVESSEELDEECTEKELLRAWKITDCPLVVVSQPLRA
jgi:hypothetical protein